MGREGKGRDGKGREGKGKEPIIHDANNIWSPLTHVSHL